jgi:tetratricopeptide (TPR) repeat protein
MLVVAAPTAVRAQADDSPSKAAPAASRKDREKRAEAAFIAGHYQEAAELLDGLYAEFHSAIYLRNLGRCHQRLKNPDRAIAAFDEYLRRGKNITAAEREEVKGFIHDMEEMKRQQEAAAAPPPPPPAPPAPVVTTPPPPVVAAAPAPPAAVLPPPIPMVATSAPPPSTGSGKLVGGLLLGAAGLLAGGGGVMLATSWSEFKRGQHLGCPGYYDCTHIKNRVDARSLWAKVLFGVAGATAIAGGTVLVLSFRRDSSSASTGLSVALEGKF